MPHKLLTDSATNGLNFAGLFLATVASACSHSDEDLEAASLKKAFTSYCEATANISQLPPVDQESLTSDLQALRKKLAAAYSEPEELSGPEEP